MPDTPHLMIVEARFYADIADELVGGAIAVLDKADAGYERVAVPGAFEIPAAIRFALDVGDDDRTPRPVRSRFDGFIALGCVIRGETSHYDYVCGESARGLQSLATAFGLALGYGILTVENRDQAWARARIDQGDKGGVAARAALDMIALRRRLAGTRS